MVISGDSLNTRRGVGLGRGVLGRCILKRGVHLGSVDLLYQRGEAELSGLK